MRLLLVLTFACVPAFSQATPQPLFQSAPPQKPKNPCDPKIRRPPLAPFNFCSTEQIAAAFGSPIPIRPLAPTLYAVCSVPLITARGIETYDSMVKPVPPAHGAFMAPVPAPPCEDWK
jgi:hypothetical protein